MASHPLYLGTYTRNSASKGIYRVELDGDTGALSEPRLVAEATDPTWLTLTPDRKLLYAVHGSPSQAIGFAVDPGTGALRPLANPPPTASVNPPAHLAVDATGRVLIAANYRDGYVAAMKLHPDGSLGAPQVIRHQGHGPNPERQEKPHVHSVTLSPDNRFVIAADLGLDKVFSYALDTTAGTLSRVADASADTEPGAGPRHFTFGRGGRHGYVINEMGGTVTVFDYMPESGEFVATQTISTLPPDFDGLKWDAEVRLHPSGLYLYASNRTHDSIAVFAVDQASGQLTLIEIVPSGGKTPRNFALSPDGDWLVCGHQDSEMVTVFRVDPNSGRLTATPHTAPVPSVVCVLFAA